MFLSALGMLAQLVSLSENFFHLFLVLVALTLLSQLTFRISGFIHSHIFEANLLVKFPLGKNRTLAHIC